jgi:hypothetical protein
MRAATARAGSQAAGAARGQLSEQLGRSGL